MTDETRQSPTETVSHGVSHEPPSMEATLAIQIADKHMRGFSIERRKALAHAIVEAIGRCEADLVAEIIGRLPPKQLNTLQRPEGERT